MDRIIGRFHQCVAEENGTELAKIFSTKAPASSPNFFYDLRRASNAQHIDGEIHYSLTPRNGFSFDSAEVNAWAEVFVNYWKAVGEFIGLEESTDRGELKDGQYGEVYDVWKAFTNSLIKYHSSSVLPFWTIPCLYTALTDLRTYAIKADEQSVNAKGSINFSTGLQDDIVSSVGKNEKLEDYARVLNRVFNMCLQDRAPVEYSRKWGTYFTANLMFKTYFKLNAVSLSKNMVQAINAQFDMPSLYRFPRSEIVTFKYYIGVMTFLREDYVQAEQNLTEAWQLCHKSAYKNHQQILTYLIPCRLITTHKLPTSELLSPYPRLQALFGPIAACIRKGDLAGFDAALFAGEVEFVKRRIYLTLERGRDIALRNLLRKVFLAGGYEPLKEGQTEADLIRRTRIPIAEFAAAIRMGLGADGKLLEDDEVECMLANMIYKNLMKGYISRERAMVVLSKTAGMAFPGTGV
ncbi:uncharacterized protein BDZ99DRAFT_124431 [Mytilinidion resinicola]|uniref:Protein CSN12 homolog n=1 Tax=Mytilinidion resinicola TaxID=574789 RepID=A0A6A6Z529_9PEZI|nr:uncharacterized protein BDZ99DRAFT_124431 [Mytilinidion resinicola]KAF2815839.1 hypothetical protein BDZ99DRAFT_124431 [Mytilinidion resinicola]